MRPNFARVGERQAASVRQIEGCAQVRAAQHRAVVRDHGQLPGHAQVDDERLPRVEMHQQIFAAPADGDHLPAHDPRAEQLGIGCGQRARPEDVRRGKPAADQLGPQVGRHSLNFWELGHGSDLLECKMRRK